MSPRIERIERSSPRSPEARITLADGRVIALLLDTVGALGLRRGEDFTSAREAHALARDQRERCRLAAWRSLARGPLSGELLRRRLLQRGFAASVVEDVVRGLTASGFIDDRAFAEELTRRRTGRDRRGPRAIAAELQHAGVARALAAEALRPVQDREHQRAAATEALQRWTGARRHPDAQRCRRAAGEFLLRRGFDSAIVWEVVREWSRARGLAEREQPGD